MSTASDADRRVALVTGGGRGIGRAVAQGLASAGLAVAVTARSIDELDETVAAVEADGGRALAVPGDVTDEQQVRHVVAQVRRVLGPVDILVNNAGVAPGEEHRLWEAEPAAWWRVIEVNLRGPFLFAHAVLGEMVERGGGHVININSLVGTSSHVAGYSPYNVSKAALFRFTDVLAAQLQGTGVAVFDVSPGLVHTRMTADLPIARDVPDEAWTPPERTAEVVLALVSGRFDHLSGRFVHAMDDLDDLLAHAGDILQRDARVLRLRLWGDDDPLA